VTGRALPLAGRQVTQLQIDHRVGLLFEDGAQVMIGGEMELAGTTLEPEETRTLGPVLDLLHRHCTAAEALPDGTLAVVFDAGVRLTVRPDQQYEAWEANGAGWVLVALPGGELAEWG
jgi:hypothetical protein